jgi:hypothetical protein
LKLRAAATSVRSTGCECRSRHHGSSGATRPLVRPRHTQKYMFTRAKTQRRCAQRQRATAASRQRQRGRQPSTHG